MLAALVAILQAPPLEAKDRCVLLSAEVSASPPQIELKWPSDPKAIEYAVFRRGLSDPAWGPLPRPEAKENRHADADVKVGEVYEYMVVKGAQGFQGVGYLRAGIEVPLVDRRGKVVLLVDATQAAALATEIRRLERDLEGDGWTVLRHDVDPSAKPADVKAVIKKDWEADREKVRALFLLGHIPVPYSGRYNPDGHPDHLGAWPADSFYGDLDGEWTDATVDFPTAARAEGKNVPGDGKLDPSQLPSDLELEVGRVDLSRMPAFGKIETGDWFKALAAGSYLFAHGSGAGGWQSCAGVGTTADFAAKPARAVFTVLFGSYFGDWDVQDGLLRAPLAADGSALACLWSGRPHAYLQSLALGETLGYAVRLTQNNRGLYQPTGAFPRGVHIALMGDPTLRIHVVAPPSALSRKGARLEWKPSPDATAGCHVYRKDGADWTRLTDKPVKETSFTDPKPVKDGAYLVRAIRLESGPGGTYFNASQGLFEPDPPAPKKN